MGLELCFGLLLSLVGSDGLRLERLLDALSTRPARIAGFAPPRVREGTPAELVLVDPLFQWTAESASLKTKSRNTPFLKRTLTGKVLMTLADGRCVFDSLATTEAGPA